MKREVKKHTSAIHTSGKLSLLERKLSNVLLYNAYDNLLLEKQHEINLTLLCVIAGYKSNEREKIKKTLEKLSTTSITWGVLDEKGNEKEWGVSTLLALAEIKNGNLTYEYSSGLARKLSEPQIYGIINLQVQRKFTSGYSLTIYEICSSYKGLLNKRKAIYTKWMTLEQFKVLLGVENLEHYNEFKYLNKKIIKQAVKEINGSERKYKNTDIFIEPEYKRANRKISDIRFKIKNHPQIEFSSNKDKNSIFRKTDNYKRLIDYGMSDKGAIKIIKIESEDYIREKLDFIDEEEKRGKIKSSASGLLIQAIQKDFKSPEKVKQGREQKKYNKEQEEQKINKEKEEKRKLESEKRLEKINSFYKNKTDGEKAELFNLFSNSSDIKNNRLVYDRVKNKGLDDEVTRILFLSFLGEHFNLSVEP